MKYNRGGLADYLRSHEDPSGIIVCKEPKFIYMKACRTGGTSILRGTLEKIIPGIIHLKDHEDVFSHWLENVTDTALEDYFIFCFVRNPWDRILSVSAYFGLSLKQMVTNLNSNFLQPDVREHSLPLFLYTHNHGIQFADFIGRFERLQDDFDHVCDKLGMEKIILPHTNKTDHEHYSKYYPDYGRQIIADMYAKDIEYYGYRFAKA